jgi:acetyl esterase/lipase
VRRRITVGVNPIPGPLTDGTAAFPYAAPSIGPSGELRYDNIVYSCEPGYRPLFLDLRLPAPVSAPHPLIIWVHGGGWIYGSRRRLPPHLFDNAIHDRMLDAGYAVASVDYRLAREAGFPGMLLDVKAAVRWLRGHAGDFHLDPERVVVWGESAGGHLAVMAALCTKLDGAERTGECLDQPETPTVVVDWYGPADLTAMGRLHMEADSEEVGATPENPAAILRDNGTWTYEELSPVTYVRADVPPIFVAHGTADQIVSVSQSRDLAARLRAVAATVDYLEVPDADHVWRGAPSVSDIVARSLSFVTEALP